MPTPDKGELWGILGGAFDPVHRGHITLAHDIFLKKDLDGILFIPSFVHPLKQQQAVAPYADRVQMLRLATGGYRQFVVEEIEKDQKLSGYTLDTVRAVKARYAGARFVFIIGADNIHQISLWHQPEAIFAEIPVVAGTRPGYTPHHAHGSLAEQIEFIETVAVDISSSEVRQTAKSQVNQVRLERWLDAKVLKYIDNHGLYR